MKNLIISENKKIYKYAIDGEYLYYEGKYKQALALFNKAIKLEPNNDMLYSSRCKINMALKNYKQAHKDIEMALKLQPNVNKYKNLEKELENYIYIMHITEKA